MTYTIGMFHYKVGGTDGVSLELEKWKEVLESMGHTVHLCGGDLGSAQGTLIEEMFHQRTDAKRLYRNTFIKLADYANDAAYRKDLYDLADRIEEKLHTFIRDNGINFLIPQNVWSVGMNPAVAIAAVRVMRNLKLPALAHNHDFYFERTDGVALTCTTAVELADLYLPPRDDSVQHAVINSLAQQKLKARKGILARVVPNVFDFEETHWGVDAYNDDFRQEIGVNDDDILILQATRVVPRKGIEMAVDFVAGLNAKKDQLVGKRLYNGKRFSKESRIVLVLAGYTQDDPTGTYLERLKEKANGLGVDILSIEDRVSSERTVKDDKKIYSLWDTYVHADFVTYPSLWEGWGNQLLEAIVAKLPVLVFEYPVYELDIKHSGFNLVSLGNQISGSDDLDLKTIEEDKINQAVEQAIPLLINAEERAEVVNHNFEIGSRYYSKQALKGYLSELMAKIVNPLAL